MNTDFTTCHSLIELSKQVRLQDGPVIFYLRNQHGSGTDNLMPQQHSVHSCNQIIQRFIMEVFQLPKSKATIYYTAAGKPFLKIPNLHLSISHTARACLIGFSSGNLGIDLESPLQDIEAALINQVASPQEKTYLLTGNTPHRFLKLWTIKEAWYKALGTGIPDQLYKKTLLDSQGKFLMKSIGWDAQSFDCPGAETASVIYKSPGRIQFFHWKPEMQTNKSQPSPRASLSQLAELDS